MNGKTEDPFIVPDSESNKLENLDTGHSRLQPNNEAGIHSFGSVKFDQSARRPVIKSVLSTVYDCGGNEMSAWEHYLVF